MISMFHLDGPDRLRLTSNVSGKRSCPALFNLMLTSLLTMILTLISSFTPQGELWQP
jgi:hypothetical protein